jgi:hypothetical protein
MPKSAEFILDPEKIQVLVVEPYGPSFAGLISKLNQNPQIQIVECRDLSDGSATARQFGSCVFLAHIPNPNSMDANLTALKQMAMPIRQKKIRPIYTTKVKNPVVHEALTAQGCTDVIDEPINERQMIFKIEKHIKALQALKPKATGQAQQAIKKTGAKEERKQAAMGTGKKAQVHLVDPLEISSDCWLLSRVQPSKVGGRWNLQLEGPGPKLGKWEKIKGTEGANEQWRWIPSDPATDPAHQIPGAWVLKGKRPEYHSGTWNFSGSLLELTFVHDGKVLATKVVTNSRGDLMLAGNSLIAQDHRLLYGQLSTMASARTKGTSGENGKEKSAKKDGNSLRRRQAGAEESTSSEDEKKAAVKLVDPCKLQSDFWLVHPTKPSRANRRWILRLYGPGPTAGRWVELDTGDASDQYWKWEPTDPKTTPFLKEKGTWVFKGLLPKFTEDSWLFVGRKPDLSFYEDQKKLGTRVAVENTVTLLLCKNSNAANAFVPEIQKSLSKVIKDLDKKSKEAEEAVQEMEGKSAAKASSDLTESEREALASDPKPDEPDEPDDPDEHDDEGKADGADEEENDRTREKDSEAKKPSKDSAEEPEIDVNDPLFKFPESKFGSSGGFWKCANVESTGYKWYVFIPLELMSGEISSPREFNKFWIQKGKVAPSLIGEEGEQEQFWVFVSSEPQARRKFDDLPVVIQEFLDHLSPEDLAQIMASREKAEKEANQTGEKLKDVLKNQEVPQEDASSEKAGEQEVLRKRLRRDEDKEAQDFEIAQGKQKQSKEMEIELDPEREAKELEAEIKADALAAEMEATQEAEEGRDLRDQRGEDEESPELKDKRGKSEDGGPALEDKRKKKDRSGPELGDRRGEDEEGEETPDLRTRAEASRELEDQRGDSPDAKPNKKKKKGREKDGATESEEDESADEDSKSGPKSARKRREEESSDLDPALPSSDEASEEQDEEPSAHEDSSEERKEESEAEENSEKNEREEQETEAASESKKNSEDSLDTPDSKEERRKHGEDSAADTGSDEHPDESASLANSGVAADAATAPSETEANVQVSLEESLEAGPLQPTLSPLALAFLVSELMAKVRPDYNRMVNKVCGYLSQGLNQCPVEFWVSSAQGWFCAGATHGDTSKYGTLVLTVTGEGQVRGPNGEELVTVSALGSQKIQAILVFSGDQARRIPAGYLPKISKMLVGLSCTLGRLGPSTAPQSDAPAASSVTSGTVQVESPSPARASDSTPDSAGESTPQAA